MSSFQHMTTAAALLGSASCLCAAACSAMLGIDGDYVQGHGGQAGVAGAATGGSGAGASGGATSGGGAGTATTSAGGGAGGSDRPDGAACAEPEQCQSERCVDGVCCDRTCDEQCRSCNQPGHLGECRDIATGENPDGDCNAEELQACDGDGECKGLEGAACDRDSDCLSDDCSNGSDTCVAP